MRFLFTSIDSGNCTLVWGLNGTLQEIDSNYTLPFITPPPLPPPDPAPFPLPVPAPLPLPLPVPAPPITNSTPPSPETPSPIPMIYPSPTRAPSTSNLHYYDTYTILNGSDFGGSMTVAPNTTVIVYGNVTIDNLLLLDNSHLTVIGSLTILNGTNISGTLQVDGGFYWTGRVTVTYVPLNTNGTIFNISYCFSNTTNGTIEVTFKGEVVPEVPYSIANFSRCDHIQTLPSKFHFIPQVDEENTWNCGQTPQYQFYASKTQIFLVSSTKLECGIGLVIVFSSAGGILLLAIVFIICKYCHTQRKRQRNLEELSVAL
uniref:Uncharacterized protein n=1 Tax=Arcella intermedia TaxID=1963864 RepID=A0A6B2L800_9EUKA